MKTDEMQCTCLICEWKYLYDQYTISEHISLSILMCDIFCVQLDDIVSMLNTMPQSLHSIPIPQSVPNTMPQSLHSIPTPQSVPNTMP